MNEALKSIIAEQQKGHENEPLYMVGLQLLDIAEREPRSAQLLEQDLARDKMKLADAADALKKYADEHKEQKQSCFCITPAVAEGILREFYGLSAAEEVHEEKEAKADLIDLANFL